MPHKDVYETIRTYNSHLSRITVMTYDQLLTNARNSLDMLGAVPVAEQDDDTDFGDDDQQDDEDDYGDRESGEDDPWAGYPGPGPDEVEAEPPF
jgi:hypothetical protein